MIFHRGLRGEKKPSSRCEVIPYHSLKSPDRKLASLFIHKKCKER